MLRDSFKISLAVVSVSLMGGFSLAQSGTWANTGGIFTGNVNMNWGVTGNWSSVTVASGVDNYADFSTLNIAGQRTVNLTSSHTIGELRFADIASPYNRWVIGGVSGSTLTLDVTAGNPVVYVGSNSTATNSAVIEGNDGLRKTGAGNLRLTASNVYTGPTLVDQGGLIVAGSLSHAAPVTVATGAWLSGTAPGVVGDVTVWGTITAGNLDLANNPGLFQARNLTMRADSEYVVDLNAAVDLVGGTTHDYLALTSINLPDGYQEVTIRPIASLGLIASQTGPAEFAFDGFTGVYEWVIARSHTNPWNLSKLGLDTSGLADLSMGPLGGWFLATSDEGRNLMLGYSYHAIPEATTLILGGMAIAPLILHRRRMRKTA